MAGPLLPGWQWIDPKGNHEDIVVQCCRAQAPSRRWLDNGGVSTCKSYGYSNGDDLYPYLGPLSAHLDFMERLP